MDPAILLKLVNICHPANSNLDHAKGEQMKCCGENFTIPCHNVFVFVFCCFFCFFFQLGDKVILKSQVYSEHIIEYVAYITEVSEVCFLLKIQ